VIVALHFLDRDGGAIEFLCSLFLNFLDLTLESLVFILGKHVPCLVLEILYVIGIFL
jgi:hypothetical protein